MLKKLREKIKKFLDDEKINDMISTIKFIFSYGIMGLFIILIFISIIGIDFIVVNIIRKSVWLTIVTFLIGSGSAYYMLMDISDFYSNLRGNKR